jgi:hypothetical protein
MPGPTYTRRAERRAQQRGVPSALIDTVFSYADIEAPVGEGRIAARLSCRAVRRLQHDCGPVLAERARNIVLILAGEVLVTVLHAQGHPGRRYGRRRR